MTGVHVDNVREFLHEIQQTGSLTDSATGTSLKMDIYDRLDDIQKTALDRIVHGEFRKAKQHKVPYVTMARIHKILLQDPTFPPMSRMTVRHVLHCHGYKLMATDSDRNVLLLEKSEILHWRRR